MGMRMPAEQDQFDIARKRAQQQANAAKQQQSDAIKRRFAAAGMQNSGAALKQEQLANQAVDKQLSESNEGIDAAARQENARKQEIADQRNFQKQEREASQSFASNESAVARKAAQDQFAENLAFQKTQAWDAQAFRDKSFEETKSQFEKNFGLAQKQFAQDREVTGLNAVIAARQAGLPWTGFTGGENGATTADIDAKIKEMSAVAKAQVQQDLSFQQKNIAAVQNRPSYYNSNRDRSGVGHGK